jgi:hypothetical protein
MVKNLEEMVCEALGFDEYTLGSVKGTWH